MTSQVHQQNIGAGAQDDGAFDQPSFDPVEQDLGVGLPLEKAADFVDTGLADNSHHSHNHNLVAFDGLAAQTVVDCNDVVEDIVHHPGSHHAAAPFAVADDRQLDA